MYGMRNWIDVVIGLLVLGVVIWLMLLAIPDPPAAVTLDAPAAESHIRSR